MRGLSALQAPHASYCEWGTWSCLNPTLFETQRKNYNSSFGVLLLLWLFLHLPLPSLPLLSSPSSSHLLPPSSSHLLPPPLPLPPSLSILPSLLLFLSSSSIALLFCFELIIVLFAVDFCSRFGLCWTFFLMLE